MIITNAIAKQVVKIFSYIVPGRVAVTIWPFIFIHPPGHIENERLIRHERKHLEQWRRFWIVGFVPIYTYQFIRYGYENTPLELEARTAEGSD